MNYAMLTMRPRPYKDQQQPPPATAVFAQSFSVSAQEGTSKGVAIKPDGTKFFITGTDSDAVHEYSLSSPWDISTSSYTASFSLDSPLVMHLPQGLAFSDDGKTLFVIGIALLEGSQQRVLRYSLPTAWSLSGATYQSSTSVYAWQFFPTGIHFGDNGLRMYVCGLDSVDTRSAGIAEFSLDSPFLVSSLSFVRSVALPSSMIVQDIAISSDGAAMYVVDSFSDSVFVYSLSTVWDISTMALSAQYNLSAQETVPTGIAVKSGGLEFFVVGQASDAAHKYALTQ